MQNFSYYAPSTLSEAIALHQADATHNRFLAGGTDLYLALAQGSADIRAVIDLKGIPGLAGVTAEPDGSVRIGALTAMADLGAHPLLEALYPALVEGARMVGGPAVRNRATLGGNICNASPAADTAASLLALQANVAVSGAGGDRVIPVAGLWRGPRSTILEPGEVVTAVYLPAPSGRGSSAFQRLTRTAMDIALVNAAARVHLDAQGRLETLVVALGAVAPTAIVVPDLTPEVRGWTVDGRLLEVVRAGAEAAARPIDDVRASARYRKEMAGVLARRAVARAAEQALTQEGGRP